MPCAVSRLDQLLTMWIYIEERYLKIKKYSSDSQHMANQDWIKYRALSRNGDKYSLQEREMLKRQQYSTMPYQGSTRLEAKPCA